MLGRVVRQGGTSLSAVLRAARAVLGCSMRHGEQGFALRYDPRARVTFGVRWIVLWPFVGEG